MPLCTLFVSHCTLNSAINLLFLFYFPSSSFSTERFLLSPVFLRFFFFSFSHRETDSYVDARVSVVSLSGVECKCVAVPCCRERMRDNKIIEKLTARDYQVRVRHRTHIYTNGSHSLSLAISYSVLSSKSYCYREEKRKRNMKEAKMRTPYVHGRTQSKIPMSVWCRTDYYRRI